MDNKPLISIIVPIYNSAEYLRRCIDSLIVQTFEEYEIIAVDNGSDDKTPEILQDYASCYPELIKIYTQPHSVRAGAGRNHGIRMARGEYICFCDSDDKYYPNALKWMYNSAISLGCDLIFAPFEVVSGGKSNIRRQLEHIPECFTVEDIIFEVEPAPWAKLFHKSLIDKSGFFPENISFEDLSYFYIYGTHFKKAGYCDHVVYTYYKRSNSEVNDLLNPRIAETVDAELFGLNHCNSNYRDVVLANIGLRIAVNTDSRWIHADKFLEHLKNLWPELENNPYLIKRKSIYGRIKRLVPFTVCSINKNIFINGFGHQLSKEYIEEIKSIAFIGESSLIILDESTCNINENSTIKEAYFDKKYDFVSEFFALKMIYLYGGIYVSRDVVIDIPFNYLRRFHVFFNIDKNNEFSDKIFGGMSGEMIYSSLLKTYDSHFKRDYDIFVPLSQRIRNVLNENHIFKEGTYNAETVIFPPEVMLINNPINDKLSLALHFSHITCSENNVIGVNKRIVTDIMIENKADNIKVIDSEYIPKKNQLLKVYSHEILKLYQFIFKK